MAPWCPACRQFSETWSKFADWGRDLDINVGVVDVTEKSRYVNHPGPDYDFVCPWAADTVRLHIKKFHYIIQYINWVLFLQMK